MLRYFPLDHDQYDMPMNARPENGPLIEVDEHYLPELAQKDEILAQDYDYYFKCPPDAEPLAWDTIALLLPDMAKHYPQHFTLKINGEEAIPNRAQGGTSGDIWTWTNRLLDSTTVFAFGDAHSLPLPPLDWLGRQVQEDLLLMAMDSSAEDGETYFAGGHLCFPASWCLEDKMGQGFMRIHENIPGFMERIGHPAMMMMRRLKPERPTGRLNWTVSSSDRLNLSPATYDQWVHKRREINSDNAGERCFFRVERQVFARLPQTNGILFSIRTYINPISEIVEDPARLRRFTSVVKGVPRATREYKGMAHFADALVDFLESRIRREEKLPRSTVVGQRDVPVLKHKKEPVMGNICLSNVATTLWEPMPIEAPDLIESDPKPKVHWLRKNEKNEPTYLAGIWHVQPATFKWLFFGHETFHVLEGRATITIDDGTSVEVKAGDIISFAMNTPSVWQVHEALKKVFVITM